MSQQMFSVLWILNDSISLYLNNCTQIIHLQVYVYSTSMRGHCNPVVSVLKCCRRELSSVHVFSADWVVRVLIQQLGLSC